MITTADLRTMAAYAARARPDEAPKEWYSISAAASGDEATVYIYDYIDPWGVSAQAFALELAALDVATIHLRINSPGGLVFDGVAIHNLLRTHQAYVKGTVDGLAASAASVIAMAADELEMGPGTQMMIHNPRGLVIGKASDVREYADLLDRIALDMAGFYARRAGGEVDEWLGVMDAETWYSAQEAVDAGLADTVSTDDTAATNVGKHDLVAVAERRGFRYAGRACAPAPTNRSRSARARHRHHEIKRGTGRAHQDS